MQFLHPFFCIIKYLYFAYNKLIHYIKLKAQGDAVSSRRSFAFPGTVAHGISNHQYVAIETCAKYARRHRVVVAVIRPHAVRRHFASVPPERGTGSGSVIRCWPGPGAGVLGLRVPLEANGLSAVCSASSAVLPSGALAMVSPMDSDFCQSAIQ